MSDQRRQMQNVRESAAKQLSGSEFSTVKAPDGMKFFKLEKGNMLIDVLPYKVGEGNPFADPGKYYHERTYFAHKRVGVSQTSHVCLARTKDKPCPICEYIDRLRKAGDLDEATEKQMRAKKRQLFLVINCKDRESGVQLLECAYDAFGKLLAGRVNSEAATQNGWDKFSDPENGFRLALTITDEKIGKNPYYKVTAIDFMERKRQYTWEFIDENTICLDDILKISKYEKLKEVIEGGGDDEEHVDDDDAPPPKKKAAAVEDDDDAPPPKKKAAAVEEEDDEVTPPKKKKAAVEEDEDDAPPVKKKAQAADNDDDWDDDAAPPKKKAAAAEEDDDAPPVKKKAAAVEDDDDAPPVKKKAAPVEEEEDDAPPPKKKAKVDLGDDDDDTPAPKKKKQAVEEED